MSRPFKNTPQQYAQWFILGVLGMVTIVIWIAVFRTDRNSALTVAFLDVGQGDAVYIEAPNGNQVLIDGGSGRAVLRALGKMMPFWDRSLDLVIATHPDQDHIGGLPSVFDRLHVSRVMTTEVTATTGTYDAFEEGVMNEHAERSLARRGERIILDRGVVLEILFPNENTRGWETNTASIVARLSYGDTSFLFTGDAPQGVEKYLVNTDSNRLRTTVLKLGHHGSRTSSAHEFLSVVDPEYAVISVGKDNTYGHPHKEVTDFLNELSLYSLSTAEQGTIVFKTIGEGVWME